MGEAAAQLESDGEGLSDQAMLAQALLARDSNALGSLYDAYSDRLFTYATGILGSRDHAADVVHDTMLLAYEHIDQLRDADRLRAWLYAICRNECMRELRGRRRTSNLEAIPEVQDHSVDLDARLGAGEAQSLVAGALAGLGDTDREVIELTLQHQLAANDVARILEVNPNQARAQMSRARSALESAVGALLLYRAKARHCDELDAIVANQQFTPLLRKRINRHIESCDTCSKSRKKAIAAIAMASIPMLTAPAWMPKDTFDAELTSASIRFDQQGWPTTAAANPHRVVGVVVAAVVVTMAVLGGGSWIVSEPPTQVAAPLQVSAPDAPAAENPVAPAPERSVVRRQPRRPAVAPGVQRGDRTANPGSGSTGSGSTGSGSQGHRNPGGNSGGSGSGGSGADSGQAAGSTASAGKDATTTGSTTSSQKLPTITKVPPTTTLPTVTIKPPTTTIPTTTTTTTKKPCKTKGC